jgi:hypothetical protein
LLGRNSNAVEMLWPGGEFMIGMSARMMLSILFVVRRSTVELSVEAAVQSLQQRLGRFGVVLPMPEPGEDAMITSVNKRLMAPAGIAAYAATSSTAESSK